METQMSEFLKIFISQWQNLKEPFPSITTTHIVHIKTFIALSCQKKTSNPHWLPDKNPSDSSPTFNTKILMSGGIQIGKYFIKICKTIDSNVTTMGIFCLFIMNCDFDNINAWMDTLCISKILHTREFRWQLIHLLCPLSIFSSKTHRYDD